MIPFIKRLISLTSLLSLILASTIPSALAFNDTTGDYQNTIDYLKDKGVIEGYNNGEFRPNDNISRAAFLKMLLANYQFDPQSIDAFTHPYDDVDNNSWYAPYIQRAWEMGLLKNNEAFYPGSSLSRLQATEWMLELLSLPIPKLIHAEAWTLEFDDVSPSAWFAPVVHAGVQNELINAPNNETNYFRPHRQVSRGEATQLIYNMDLFVYGDESDNIQQVLYGDEIEHTIPNLDIFLDVWDRIHDQYYGRDDLNEDALIYEAITGLVEGLDDPYSVYFDPPESDAFTSTLEGDVSGIGAYIDNSEEGGVRIQGFLIDSPAEASGLKINDRIIAIDGTDVRDKQASEIGLLIRGEADTDVTLTIERDGETEPLSFTITRADLEITYVSGEMLGDAVYIDINMFSLSSANEFATVTSELLDENPQATGLIIDLRDNPGGYLNSAIDMLGHFVPNGEPVLWADYGGGRQQLVLSQGDAEWADLPVVLLINENSASASEILTIGLKETIELRLVGKTTFGKGTVQQVIYYTDGSALKLTIAEWRSPDYHSINGIGISPQFDIDLTEEDIANGEDPQLEKALEVLAGWVEHDPEL